MRLLKEIRNLLDNYHVKSGIYHYYRGEFGPAVDFFRKALDADEDLAVSDRRIARYYLTMTLMESAERREVKGELEEAVGEYTRAVEVSPTYPDIRLRFGKVLERMGRHEDAIRQYRKAIENNRRYRDAWVSLGFCLLRVQRRDEAAEAFGNACDLELDRIRHPFEGGVAALRDCDDLEAEARFHDAFVFVPQLFEQRYVAALAHLKAEDHESALVALDSALELNPRYPDLYNFRGIALCELGRTEEGVESFRRSAALSPKFVVPRLNLAFALLRMGDFKEAESELERILEDDPTEPAARAKLDELRSGGRSDKRRTASRGGAR